MTGTVDDDWLAKVLEGVPATHAVELLQALRENIRWNGSPDVTKALKKAEKDGVCPGPLQQERG